MGEALDLTKSRFLYLFVTKNRTLLSSYQSQRLSGVQNVWRDLLLSTVWEEGRTQCNSLPNSHVMGDRVLFCRANKYCYHDKRMVLSSGRHFNAYILVGSTLVFNAHTAKTRPVQMEHRCVSDKKTLF